MAATDLTRSLSARSHAQCPINDSGDQDAHPIIRQVTGRHGQPETGDPIDRTIESVTIPRPAVPSARRGRRIHGRAQHCRYRTGCPNDPRLGEPCEIIKSRQGPLGLIPVNRLGRETDGGPFLDKYRDMDELSGSERCRRHRDHSATKREACGVCSRCRFSSY